jgi:hypothetical protein
MPPKHITPATSRNSFSCPRCGALADQRWFTVGARRIEKDDSRNLPAFWRADIVEKQRNDSNIASLFGTKKEFDDHLRHVTKAANGEILLMPAAEGERYHLDLIENVHVSRCYSCQEIALWKYDTLLFPREKYDVEANADLNEDIRHDFDEAREVLDISPRGAAALLRLCLQKLCLQLGFSGKNINFDIGEMVKSGLNPKIQKALDIVRVVGNEAVHPGTMDLRDDRETAIKLFGLVNHIAIDMISQPKEIEALYGTLPPEKLAAIVKRDA